MQNGCKIKVGDKKIFLCQRSTDHSPQQVVVKSNFGFQLGINFDNGLQIAVDSQLWTVDKFFSQRLTVDSRQQIQMKINFGFL